MRPISIAFDAGTIVVRNLPADFGVTHPALARLLTEDPRTASHRAPALAYRDIALGLHRDGVEFDDSARRFERLTLERQSPIDPFPHQAAALAAWTAAGKRGIVELPTGAGKTILAVLAIGAVQRPTLVVVPTLDLLAQWQGVLEKFFGGPIGAVGGGVKERHDITVTTYDSAAFHTEFVGDRYGFLVCDECHHLPAPAYRFIASGMIAPFRLGLTATLERADGGESVCARLLGDPCFSVTIDELEGDYLAPYEIDRVEVSLTEDEQVRYETARAQYLGFLRGSGVILSRPGGWAQFIMRSQQSEVGRAAFAAYREQRRIAFTSAAKFDALWQVVLRHANDRIIVFTEDNETVHRLSERLLMPAITHETKLPERKRLLSAFAAGDVPVLLTSKVLNEGVDVPDANIGVVLSGSGSVREHVQRLGRILRKRPDKRAVLYEICTNVQAESGVSERRRQHRAYARGEEQGAADADA